MLDATEPAHPWDTSIGQLLPTSTGCARRLLQRATPRRNHSTQFALRSYCGSTVAVGDHCWIAVTFKPAYTGIASASLHVRAGDIDRNRAITGTGIR